MSDIEPGLSLDLEGPTLADALRQAVTVPDTFDWEHIGPQITGEARRITEVYARLTHVFLTGCIICAAVYGHARFELGPPLALGIALGALAFSPFLSWFLVRWGLIGDALDRLNADLVRLPELAVLLWGCTGRLLVRVRPSKWSWSALGSSLLAVLRWSLLAILRSPLFALSLSLTLLRWMVRRQTIRLISPSYLVGIVALFGAFVAIEHTLTALRSTPHFTPEASTPYRQAWITASNTLGDVSGLTANETQRARDWLWEGRAELALSILLGLAAFLIENVLGDLSLTRRGLKDTTENAARASSRVEEILGTVTTLRDETARDFEENRQRLDESGAAMDAVSLKLARSARELSALSELGRFLSVAVRAQDLVAKARRTFDASGHSVDILGLGLAQEITGRRFASFVAVFSQFFGNIEKAISGGLTDPAAGPRSPKDERDSLYELNLLGTVLEASMETQDRDFSKALANGRHFEFVAPFEALAAMVEKFIESAMGGSRSAAEAGEKRAIAFYTVLPLRPEEFLGRAKWRQEAGKLVPLDSLAAAWIGFLSQSYAATTQDNIRIVRHFLCIEDELIDGALDARKDGGRLKWNPLYDSSPRFLLRESEVQKEVSDRSYLPDLSNTAFPWALAVEAASNGRDECLAIKVGDAGSIEGGRPLSAALEHYHRREGDGGPGLRFMRIAKADCVNFAIRPDSPVLPLLSEQSAVDILVDIFAARIEIRGSAKEWAFVVESRFDPEMGVVKMRLFSRTQHDWSVKEREMDKLFGVGPASRQHIGFLRKGAIEWGPKALRGLRQDAREQAH